MGKARVCKRIGSNSKKLSAWETEDEGAAEEAPREAWIPPRKFLNIRKWLYKAEGAFQSASSLADVLHKCTKEPSVWNIAKTGFDLAHRAQQFFMINYHTHFDGWSAPFSDDYNYVISEVLKHLPYEEKLTTDENLSLRRVAVPRADGSEFDLYYAVNIEHDMIEGVHVQSDDVDDARDFIKKAFWQAYDEQFLLMHRKKVYKHGTESGEFLVFDPDDEVEPMMSGRAKQIADKTRKFLDAKVSRSILLYGPPGTGKSTMVRAIVRNLGLKSLRIRVEDLEEFSNTVVFEAIKIFEPQCIIIDDLDRTSRLSHLLEMLERFNKKLKVVFATVNDKDLLGDAILRPGRFDELIEIKELEEETIRRILGPGNSDVFEVVKRWPIAYTIEYVKRKKHALSDDDALDALAELHHRVHKLDGYLPDADDGPLVSGAELLEQAKRGEVGVTSKSEVTQQSVLKTLKALKSDAEDYGYECDANRVSEAIRMVKELFSKGDAGGEQEEGDEEEGTEA